MTEMITIFAALMELNDGTMSKSSHFGRNNWTRSIFKLQLAISI